MPANIEIKAVLPDRNAAEKIAARLSDHGPELIEQQDIFFDCQGARLKLRIFSPERADLIRYERVDLAEIRRSSYMIASTPDPQALLAILSATLGQSGMVKKTRTLYLAGQTRIHLDRVEGLGDFLELEVVLKPGQTDAEGKLIADKLLAEFSIGPEQLIAEAYVDLLARARAA